MYDIIMFAFGVLFIVLQLLLINYLLRLERIGCKCAIDWRRKFMIAYMFLLLVHAALVTFVTKEVLEYPIIQTIMLVLGVVNVIITLQYLAQLRRDNCNCSESMYKDIITMIAYLNTLLYFFMLVVVAYFMFSMAYRSKMENADAKPAMSVRKLFSKKKK